MAEHVVTSLLPQLTSLALQEANFLGGVDKQIISLHDEFQLINSFLRDADKKRTKNERVDIWVSQIRNLAYDTQDVIDLFILKVEQQRQNNIGLRFMGYANHFLTLHQLGNQIEDINRRIRNISDNKLKYGIERLQAGESSTHLNDGLAWKVRRALTEEEHEVVGFGKHIEEVAMFLKQEESRQLFVVSIVGMGGAGKSTLARTVYKRSDVMNTFDSYAWIHVSQDYRMKDLLFGAITQVMILTNKEKKELETKNEQELEEMLSGYLKDRSCLLVFDDVWQREDWDYLKSAFLAQHEGKPKRVLLTTRIVEVAKHADPLREPHELNPLGYEDSFNLFSQKVFRFQERSEEKSYSKELEEVGRELVARCGGLPLAIVVLGGLLSTKEKTPSVWTKVLESLSWQLSQGPQHCMDILALSYTNLPYYLQPCFLYFGLFPKDYEIVAFKLIQLWVAEGFIQQRGDESMEDVAEEYLEELIQRSMIQATSRRSDGGARACRIHDLLLDLAVSEAKKDNLLEIYGNSCSTSLNRFRRLGIHLNNGMHQIPSSTLHQLHSFLCFSVILHRRLWKHLYVGFNLLRVLDLKDVRNLRSLPKEIGWLVLLKYLDLSGSKIRRIPHSIGKLCYLQTLRVSWGYIPKKLWRMQHLRHFHSYGSFIKFGHGSSRPPRIDNLRELQTLSLYAGSWIEGGLDKLTNLRELKIWGNLTLHTEALTDSITKLKKLRVLNLQEWNLSPNAVLLPHVSFSNHVHLYHMCLYGRLEKIPVPEDFPKYLRELQLYGLQLKQQDQPVATLGKLPNLKILKLGFHAIEGKEMVFPVGGFAKLQILAFDKLFDIEDLQVEQGAFPCLKVLRIRSCHRLKMLPDGLRHVSTLQELHIIDMPKEFRARVQEDKGEDWEKIKHIPSIYVDQGSYAFRELMLNVDLLDYRVFVKVLRATPTLSGADLININPKAKQIAMTGEVNPVAVVFKLRKICGTKIVYYLPAGERYFDVDPQLYYLQKVVLKVDLRNDRSKDKAIKKVHTLSGIRRISMDMTGLMTVIGEMDPVDIVKKLRKLWVTHLVSIGPAKEPEPEEEP